MTKLLSTVAAVALSVGAASMSAKAETPANFTGVQTSEAPAVAQASCYYRTYYFYDSYGNLYYRPYYYCY